MQKLELDTRRWWYIMPIVFITYSLAYLDRGNYSLAAAAGMAEDLNLTPAISSLIASLFFLGYFFFQVPGAIYAQQRSVKKLIFVSLISWGILATLTGMVTSSYVLIAIRFMLGIFEAAVMPAMLVYLCNWFTSVERSRANTLFILGNPVTMLWMSVVSGHLIHNYNWRWMFIIEGLPAIVWAFIWWAVVDDYPEQAKWLSSREKENLKKAMQEEQTHIAPVRNYTEAFRSSKVVLLSVVYFFWSLSVYGIALWLPSIIRKSANIDMIQSGWLTAAPYLASVLGMLLVSWNSDKRLKRKVYIWSSLSLASIAFFAIYILDSSNFWISYVLLLIAAMGMYAPYGPFFAMISEILPSNVAGVSMALINSLGALGSFFGSYLVGYLNKTTGSATSSYLLMSISLFIAVLFILSLKTRQ